MSIGDGGDVADGYDIPKTNISSSNNNNGIYTISSLDEVIQDSDTANGISRNHSKSMKNNYVNISENELPHLKEMLEETVKYNSVTTVEESIRRQMREWTEREEYFDHYFRKIIRKKTDRATYGPQLLTWDILSELYQIVSQYHE